MFSGVIAFIIEPSSEIKTYPPFILLSLDFSSISVSVPLSIVPLTPSNPISNPSGNLPVLRRLWRAPSIPEASTNSSMVLDTPALANAS